MNPGALTAVELAEFRRLMRLAQDMERRQAFGGGLDTSAGAPLVQPRQMGFAAELTSSYDAETGYSWKRLYLETSDPPGFVDPDVQPEGDKAFTPGGDETLADGTRVWLEPSPDASGYVIVPTGSGGGSTRFVFFTLPSALAITDASKASCPVNDFWGGPDPGATITVHNLPASSDYIFSGASGAKGLAVYDDTDDKHWIIVLEQSRLAKFVRFTLPSTLAITDASKASCTVDDFWGGASPGGTVTVHNLPASSNHIFAGASGAKGLATYDEIDGKYWIVQLEC